MTSNVIAPGPIADTEGMSRLAKQGPESVVARGVPVQRWGRVREISDATVWLFADTGSFVSGTQVVVDGGQWRMAGKGADVVPYPEFFKEGGGGEIGGVKSGRKAKL